jgi:phosphate starvation-inducible PhoH-like protein
MSESSTKILKNDIKYKISLNEEQKKVKAGVFEKDVSVILGPPGSGKTQTAVLIALDLLFKKHVDKIIISRPIVPNKLGYLPGEVSAKMQQQIAPIRECMYDAYGGERIDKMFLEAKIQILPVDFMKGITYRRAAVIIDEVQDMDYQDFILSLTRLGIGSKLLYTGSVEQIDRSLHNSTCINSLLKLSTHSLVNFHILKENHRNPVIFDLINHMSR